MNCVLEQDVPDHKCREPSANRTPQIAIFDFKAFLNMASFCLKVRMQKRSDR